jgi:hypothetical protein
LDQLYAVNSSRHLDIGEQNVDRGGSCLKYRLRTIGRARLDDMESAVSKVIRDCQTYQGFILD